VAILQTICEYPHPQVHFEGDALSLCDGGRGTGRDGGGGMECELLLGTGTGRDGGGGIVSFLGFSVTKTGLDWNGGGEVLRDMMDC
jgi:hypothetical protein